MCGVIAFFSSETPNVNELRLLQNIVRESEIRGRHAAGVAYYDIGGIQFAKLSSAEAVCDYLQRAWRARAPRYLIAHTRYSTSGDWRDPDNNQPLVLNDAALAFNGVIDMGTKAEMEERHGVDLLSENDGELFLQKIADGENVADWVVTGGFSFAGAYLSGGEVRLLRNERRPLVWAKVGGVRVAASTADIMSRAGVTAQADYIGEVPPGRIHCLSSL
jgi:glutamine phosphoribosylpyrophosphate amidotransferase